VRRTLAIGLGWMVLGCGGVGDLVEDVGDGVETRVAEEIEKGVAKGLGVPPDQVDIHKDGDRWKAELPQGTGDCALGAHANDAGLPLAMNDVLARCDVTVDLEELAGKEAAQRAGSRFDVAVRRPKGAVSSQVTARRKELKAAGMQVMDFEHEGFTVLVGLTRDTPAVVAVVGDGGAGPIELVAVPENPRKGTDTKPGKGGKGRKGKRR